MYTADIVNFESETMRRTSLQTDKIFKEMESFFPNMMNQTGYKAENAPVYKDKAFRESRFGGYTVDNSRVFIKSLFSKKTYEELLNEYKLKAKLTTPLERIAESGYIKSVAIPVFVSEVVTIEQSIYSEMLKSKYGEAEEKRFLLRNLPFVREERQSSVELLENAENNGLDVSRTLEDIKAHAIRNDEDTLISVLEQERIKEVLKNVLSKLNKDYLKAIKEGTDTIQTTAIKNLKLSLNDIQETKSKYFKHFAHMSREEILRDNALQLDDLQNLLENNVFTSGKPIYSEMMNYMSSKDNIYSGNYSKKDIEGYLGGQYKIYESVYHEENGNLRAMETVDFLSFRKNLELAREYVANATNEELLSISKTKTAAFIMWDEKCLGMIEDRKDLDIKSIKQNLQRTSFSLDYSIIESFDETSENSKIIEIEQSNFDKKKEDSATDADSADSTEIRAAYIFEP